MYVCISLRSDLCIAAMNNLFLTGSGVSSNSNWSSSSVTSTILFTSVSRTSPYALGSLSAHACMVTLNALNSSSLNAGFSKLICRINSGLNFIKPEAISNLLILACCRTYFCIKETSDLYMALINNLFRTLSGKTAITFCNSLSDLSLLSITAALSFSLPCALCLSVLFGCLFLRRSRASVRICMTLANRSWFARTLFKTASESDFMLSCIASMICVNSS